MAKGSSQMTRKKVAPRPKAVYRNDKPGLIEKGMKFFKPTLRDACSTDPTCETFEGNFNWACFDRIAQHIVFKANERLGIIPKTSTSFTPNGVALYLAKLYAAYQVKCKVNDFNVGDYTGYLHFMIPGYVGVLFHSSLKICDRVTSGQIVVIDPGYATYLEAWSYAEGYTRCPVTTGSDANGEPTFGAGGTVLFATISQDEAADISRIISSAFDYVVPVSDLAEHISSYSSLLASNYTSIKPVSAPSARMNFIRPSVSMFPCTSTDYPSSTWWNEGDTMTAALLWLFEDLPYHSYWTVNSMIRHRGIEPFKMTVSPHPLSYPRFAELCFALLKKNNVITPAMSGNIAWSYLGNWIPYLFTGASVHYSWITRTASMGNQYPFFVAPSYRGIKGFPGEVANGFLPHIIHSTVVVPHWNLAATSSFYRAYQPSSAVLATTSPTVSNLPVSGTIPSGYTFAGFTPPSSGTFNLTPLRILDSLQSVVLGLGNTYLSQTSVLPTDAAICPCLCECALSGDTLVVSSTMGAGAVWNWIMVDAMYTAVPMGAYHCACAAGANLLDGTGWSRFYRYLRSETGDQVNAVITAGFRDTNYEAFAAANQSKNPGDSMMSFFRDRMLDEVRTAVKNVKPSDLIPIVEALKDTGYMPVDINPSILSNLKGEYNLPWLISAVGTAVAKYGPGVLDLLKRNKSIRARVEL